MAALDFFICTEDEKKRLEKFFTFYSIEREVTCPAVRPASQPKDTRVCRYCGASGPGKWKKEAHAIPNFMGNNTLFADDECSECNERFSKNETHLAAFLGLARTVNQVSGKRGVPKFKSADKKVEITGDEIWYGRQHVRIERTDDGKSNLRIDKVNGICEVVVKKETYIPMNASKALIKIAYSFLPQEVLSDYTSTLEFITTNKLDQAFTNACVVNSVIHPLGIGTTSPFLLLCKKKDPAMNVPTYCVMFFWQSHFYQFSIPFHEADIERFAGKPLNDVQLPPFLFVQPDRPVKSVQRILQMGVTEPLKGEEEVLRFEYNGSIPLVCFDPESQQFVDKPFDPEQVRGIHLVEGNFFLPITKPEE